MQQGVVAQRIHVRVGAVVKAVPDGIERAARLSRLRRAGRAVPHLVLRLAEIEIVDRFLKGRKTCERHHNAILYQRQRLLRFLRRHQVERAALILLAPAAPVGEALLHRSR
jgi:hypothetical protein